MLHYMGSCVQLLCVVCGGDDPAWPDFSLFGFCCCFLGGGGGVGGHSFESDLL